MAKTKRVLVIDDEPSICWGLSRLCKKIGLECDTVSSAESGLEQVTQSTYQVIIMDVRLPGIDGLSAINLFKQAIGPTPVIIITAFGDLQTAITAIKRGAYDYVVKPFDLDDIQSKIEQAVATFEIASTAVRSSDVSTNRKNSLVGNSPVMQEVFKQIAFTTTTNLPVLITGENGTGKELVARAIHRFGNRPESSFVAVNIASLNPSLIESELFGHLKGAFTDSRDDRTGLIEQAHGGTLFLDEVAEIPVEIQVKLLRTLDQGEVTPVGSNLPVKTEFRLITATNQDLLEQLNHGEFRHDFFYRIRTFEIQLPPLRQRKEDIPELVEYFLNLVDSERKLSTTTDFIAELQSRSWPGNVRELRNAIERSVILARGHVLTSSHLEDTLFESHSIDDRSLLTQEIQQLVVEWAKQNWDNDPSIPLYDAFLELIDKPIIETAYELSNRQYSAAARRLGIHRTTLKKKLERTS